MKEIRKVRISRPEIARMIRLKHPSLDFKDEDLKLSSKGAYLVSETNTTEKVQPDVD